MLFEGRPLPRPKLCGGGLTPKAQRLVPREALDVVERRVDRVEIRTPHLGSFRIEVPGATIAMVERRRFDHALVAAAARAGADVRDATPVTDIVERPDGVTVRTATGRYEADCVVIADGEPSRLSRAVGLGSPANRLALALEIDVPPSPLAAPDTSVLSFGLRGGYGWYFPKNDHASLGVGSYRHSQHRRLRNDLVHLGRDLGLEVDARRVRGHWIPMGLRVGSVASERIVSAGDAAATADALFGEGIAYALLSGVVAAQAISDWSVGAMPSLRGYDGRLRRALGPPLGRLGLIAAATEVSTSAALLAVRLSGAVRERAVDAIGGWSAPFDIDRHCEVACACDLHEDEPASASIANAHQRADRRHCAGCTMACAA